MPRGRGPAGWRQCPSWQGGSLGACQPQEQSCPVTRWWQHSSPAPAGSHFCLFPSQPSPCLETRLSTESSGTNTAGALLRSEYVSNTGAKFLLGYFSQCRTAPREVSSCKETSTAVTALSQKCLCCGCLAHENC